MYRTEISSPASEAPLYLEVPVSDIQDVFSIAHDGDFLYYTALGGAAGIYRIADDVLSIEEVETATLRLFPNPAQDEITISGLSLDGSRAYTIINTLGQVVTQNTLGQSSEPIDVSQLPQGVYVLRFSNREAVRFVKN